jgi:hypothetical protein
MQDELDKHLQFLFQEKSCDLPEEPFLSNMLKLIQRRQSLLLFRQKLILFLGFSCFAFLSPLLIKGSILLSSGLSGIFEAAGNFLDTPAGMLSGILCSIVLVFILKRRPLSTFLAALNR